MTAGRPTSRLLVLFLLLATAAFAEPRVDHVVVLKSRHKLLLMLGKRVVKTYDIALGRGGLAPKQRQGDGRTPEGVYKIDYRNPASRYHLALHISYPDLTDKQRAQQFGANPGGGIMIHGLGPGFSWAEAYHRLTDWTEGCIAVTDREIEEIWKLVPDGTPVEIRP